MTSEAIVFDSERIYKPLIKNIPTHSYRSNPATRYLISLNDGEPQRLAMQHCMLRYIFDGRLIMAPVFLAAGDKVLDCGTGSGIWLQDLAMELPKTITLYGIDLESGNFPPAGTIQHENIKLSIASTTSLPDHWTNDFAFVHQRLLISSFTHEDWSIALKEVYRVLKPGGWVELCEIGTASGSENTNVYLNLMHLLYDSSGLFFDCAQYLPEIVAKAGFVNVHYDVRKQPLGKWGGKLGTDNRNNLSSVLRGIKSSVLNAGGFGIVNTEQEYDQLIEDVVHEWDNSPGLTEIPWALCYAQKPFNLLSPLQ